MVMKSNIHTFQNSRKWSITIIYNLVSYPEHSLLGGRYYPFAGETVSVIQAPTTGHSQRKGFCYFSKTIKVKFEGTILVWTFSINFKFKFEKHFFKLQNFINKIRNNSCKDSQRSLILDVVTFILISWEDTKKKWNLQDVSKFRSRSINVLRKYDSIPFTDYK